MENITSGRNIRCKEHQGGIKELYLLNFVKYSRRQVIIEDMVLTSFPDSTYYKFETYNNFGIDQIMNENEGGKYYDFNFSVDIDGHIEIDRFLNLNFRSVALDRIGNYRMFGLWNGITCDSIEKTTGSSKSDFNGYRLSFSGQEEFEAPYLSSLNELEEGFLLQEDGNNILQEDNNRIRV